MAAHYSNETCAGMLAALISMLGASSSVSNYGQLSGALKGHVVAFWELQG